MKRKNNDKRIWFEVELLKAYKKEKKIKNIAVGFVFADL